MGHEEGRKIKRGLGFKIFIGGVCAAVLAAVVLGLALSGSPESARSRQFDDLRSANLQEIKFAVDAYFNSAGKLPDSLSLLASEGMYPINSIADPKTEEAYEYRALSAENYELCANFETDSALNNSSGKEMLRPAYPYPGAQGVNFFEHGAGRQCFASAVLKQPAAPLPVKY